MENEPQVHQIGGRRGRGRGMMGAGMGAGIGFTLHKIVYLINIIPKFQYKSFSGLMIFLNIIVYIVCAGQEKYTDDKWRCVLFNMGAKHGPTIGMHQEFYRLFTALFLHNSMKHLGTNLFGLVVSGYKFEQKYGVLKYATTYFVSGILGNLFAVWYNYNSFAIGASTALYGLISLKFVYLFKQKNTMSKDKFNKSLCRLGVYVMINLYMHKNNDKINACAHFGGLIVGIIMYQLFNSKSFVKKMAFLGFLILVSSVLVQRIMILGENKKPVSFYQTMEKTKTVQGKKEEESFEVKYCSKAYQRIEEKELKENPPKKTKEQKKEEELMKGGGIKFKKGRRRRRN